MNGERLKLPIGTTVEFTSPGISYHSLIEVKVGQIKRIPPMPSNFFFNFWSSHVDFQEIVENS